MIKGVFYFMSKPNIKRQLGLLYISNFLFNIPIAGAAWVLLLVSDGYSLIQVGFAETVFHITSLICEIPSGMMADVYGRKKMLALGNIMAFIGCLITAVSENFTVACMAMPFYAMAYNFASGSGEALAYDSMKKVGKEAGFEKYNSNQFIIYRIFNGISTLCAGLALYLGYRKAYFISAATGLITLFFTLKLVEVRVGEDPAKDKDVSTKAMAKKLIEYFAESIRFLFRNPKAAKLMFLNSFVGAIDILLLFFLQSKIRDAGISNVFLGVALFTMELGGVVGSKLIVKFKKVKYAYLFIICTIGVLAGVVLEHSGIVPIMTLGGFIASLADDAIEIRTAAKLHDMFPSDQRATLVSISSFTFSVIMIVLSPLAGFFFSIW